MPRVEVLVRPKPGIGRNSGVKAPPRSQLGFYVFKESAVVFDMLDDVKEAYRGKGSVREPGLLKGGTNDVVHSPSFGVAGSVCRRFHQDRENPRLVKTPGNEAIPPPDVKKGTGWGKKSHYFGQAGVSMPEPEGIFLDLEISLAGVFGVGKGGVFSGAGRLGGCPYPFRGKDEVLSPGVEVRHG
jgi:hypothetical protein